MDRTKTAAEHSKALHRIVAVLLALADLAERASSRSPAVRALVLWLLRSGEVMARDYLAGLTPFAINHSEPTTVPLSDDSAAEAMRLAAGFRKLAATLTALAAKLPTLQAIAVRGVGPRLGAHATTNPLAALFCLTPAVERLDSS